MDLRALPPLLCMGDSTPFCQQHHYKCEDQMDAMLGENYFLSCRSHLRAGDGIRIIQVVNRERPDERVVARADVVVIEVGRDFVKLDQLGPVQKFPKRGEDEAGRAEEPPKEIYLRGNGEAVFRGPQRRWEVEVDGRIVATNLDKKSAQAVVRGDRPIPQERAA